MFLNTICGESNKKTHHKTLEYSVNSNSDFMISGDGHLIVIAYFSPLEFNKLFNWQTSIIIQVNSVGPHQYTVSYHMQ